MPEFIRTIKQLSEIAPIGERSIRRKLERRSASQTKLPVKSAVICGVKIEFIRASDDTHAAYLISNTSYIEFRRVVLRDN